jgi:hypothetical protein
MSKKYHEEHPTISFRCHSIEEYKQIKRMVQNSGKSESEFIREILLRVAEKESKSYQAGYNNGINKLTLRCTWCKKPTGYKLGFRDEQVLEDCIGIMGYYPIHEKCLQKKQQQTTV